MNALPAEGVDHAMLTAIISQFSIPGTVLRAGRFGSGLINDTYLCEFREDDGMRKYILQRINAAVFKRPDQVMENVETVTAHMVRRLRAEGVDDPASVTPALVPARTGRSYYRDEAGGYWRMFHFIESCSVFDTVKDARHAHEIGRGLGRFQALVSDLSPDALHDTLPDFTTPIHTWPTTMQRSRQTRGTARRVRAWSGISCRRGGALRPC